MVSSLLSVSGLRCAGGGWRGWAPTIPGTQAINSSAQTQSSSHLDPALDIYTDMQCCRYLDSYLQCRYHLVAGAARYERWSPVAGVCCPQLRPDTLLLRTPRMDASNKLSPTPYTRVSFYTTAGSGQREPPQTCA